VSHPVVRRALVGVRENLVGLPDGLELRAGALVVVDVGMVLPGHLAVGGLDFVLRGVLGHVEQFVEVLGHSRGRRGYVMTLFECTDVRTVADAERAVASDGRQTSGARPSEFTLDRRRRVTPTDHAAGWTRVELVPSAT
jgi:hypothetical protein